MSYSLQTIQFKFANLWRFPQKQGRLILRGCHEIHGHENTTKMHCLIFTNKTSEGWEKGAKYSYILLFNPVIYIPHCLNLIIILFHFFACTSRSFLFILQKQYIYAKVGCLLTTKIELRKKLNEIILQFF